jgi:DNA mismatch repair protein MutL
VIARIRKLPDHLVNKIAAGEVVERPSSVVKELVENALDAGAAVIAVELRDGGTALVRVTDDGIGMTPEELPLALERHATSKLARDEDLEAIDTLGFRGEALPAICAVARFAITSRPRLAPEGRTIAPEGRTVAPEGSRVAGEGGGVAQCLSVPSDVGTTVEVRDLFFNTPARLKFLKSAPTELAATLRVLTNLAVAHPDVQFRVSNNGRAVLTAPKAAHLRERLGALWGWEPTNRLLPIDHVEHGVSVRGVASPPDLTRGNRDDLVVVVNGRPVRDPALLHAVLEAYRPLLPRDRFPLVALLLGLAAADVDVNVHPTKAWVRFRHPLLVHEMIVTAVRDALRQRAVMPELHPSDRGPAVSTEETGAAPMAEPGAAQPALFAEGAASYGAPAFGRVLGQVQDTFIVTTSDREVFFVDQHVAHERVLFERLETEVSAGTPASQALLFPEELALSPAARALLLRWRAPLEELGFVFDGFERGEVMLQAVPALLKGDEPRRLIEAAIDELAGPRGGQPALDRAMAFVSCRAAIKANTPLAREEMERLVADLAATATPYFCPHGRPIVSRLSMQDIRRELKRNW